MQLHPGVAAPASRPLLQLLTVAPRIHGLRVRRSGRCTEADDFRVDPRVLQSQAILDPTHQLTSNWRIAKGTYQRPGVGLRVHTYEL